MRVARREFPQQGHLPSDLARSQGAEQQSLKDHQDLKLVGAGGKLPGHLRDRSFGGLGLTIAPNAALPRHHRNQLPGAAGCGSWTAAQHFNLRQPAAERAVEGRG